MLGRVFRNPAARTGGKPFSLNLVAFWGRMITDNSDSAALAGKAP